MSPSILKAKFVFGKNVVLRDIEEDDAEFVLGLRLDPDKGKYLSATSGKLDDQICWIKSYKERTGQAYFIVCDNDGERLGCMRMYDPIGSSYCWGSWLMTRGLSPLISIESVILLYAYGRYLGFDEARIDVRKDNEFVWKFHENFSSAELIKETEIDRYYVVRNFSISKILSKYSHLVSRPLKVVH